jgi:hypothetical protein
MSKMNSDRIKKIHEATAYPESVSVQQALLKVWNESKQLEAENAKLRATLSVIREKISDTTFHGQGSFSACLSYIDVLAKDKLEQSNEQGEQHEY